MVKTIESCLLLSTYSQTRKHRGSNEAGSSDAMAVIGPVWVDGSFFGSENIMSGLDSGDFWVSSGGFRWFRVVSGFINNVLFAQSLIFIRRIGYFWNFKIFF